MAEDQDARPAGVRDRRLHEGPGAAPGPLRRRSCSGVARRRVRLGRQRRHRLHRQEIDELLAKLRPLERTERPSGRPEDAEGAQGRRRLGEPGARLRGRVRRVDARGSAAGARRSRGCGRTRPRGEVHREEPLPTELRRGSRTLKLSNLDKVFFPDDGITKGDLLAYYRAVAPVLAAAPEGPAVHDEALSRRDRGRPFLPEGRAQAHAGLDPDTGVRGLDPRLAQAPPQDPG